MAEIDDLVGYYSNLLIKQYHDKAKAKATVEAVVRGMLSDLVFKAVGEAFDLTSASGAQLDILAKYVGVKRAPLGINLSDTDLSFLIKMMIAKNLSNQSLKSIDDYMYLFFNDSVIVTDGKDMTITYDFPLPIADIMDIALTSDLIPRPAGVAIVIEAVSENGTFGYSRLGTADEIVNGYGFDDYEGGTLMRVFWLQQ